MIARKNLGALVIFLADEPIKLQRHEGTAWEDGAMQAFQQELSTPKSDASRNEMGPMLEKAFLSLPDGYRAVVVLRGTDEMSTAESAEALALCESKGKSAAAPCP